MSESTIPETRSAAQVSPTAEAAPTASPPDASPAGSPAAGPAAPEAGPATSEAAVAALAATGPGSPFLIGVRHHAPSLAAALPALLDAAAPDVLLVELPAEFQPWLGWLAHEETEAPVALAAVPGDGPGPGSAGERGPAFYPFADFSPELVALRWAARNGIPAVACDLPLADRAWAGRGTDTPAPVPGADSVPGPGEGRGLSDALRSRLTGRDGDDLWDRLVEALAPGSTPEALRRAALLTGWALRHEAEARGEVQGTDLVREACMRRHVAEALASGRRPAVVVGAFHTPALLPSAAAAACGPVREAAETAQAPEAAQAEEAPEALDRAAASGPGTDGRVYAAAGTAPCTVSLVPYTYPLLDSRSGYPAGIRDPEWQHTVLDAAGDPAALHRRSSAPRSASAPPCANRATPMARRTAGRSSGWPVTWPACAACPPPAAASSWKPCRRCSGAARPTARAVPSPEPLNRYSSEPVPGGPHRPLRAADWALPSRPRPRRSRSPVQRTRTRRHRETSASTRRAPPWTGAANCCCAG